MCTRKVFSLAAEALEGPKNSYTQEKPMVSLQFGQVKMTILLFLILTMAWFCDKLLFAPTMLEIMSILIVEILRTEAKGWHLNRKICAVKLMIKWPMAIAWYWLKSTDSYKVATICNEFCWKCFIIQTIKLFKVLPNCSRSFDSTLGYPGEGWPTGRQRNRKRKKRKEWSTNFANLSMATWNTRSMTTERYDYCRNMGYDVLAVTELWRKQDKFTNRSNEFTVSATARDKFGNLRNEKDPAAGVGIILSPRAQKKFMGAGNNDSERICWVRLRGPACNLFIVAVYMPHSKRVQPAQIDTLRELDTICKQAKKGDCIVVMGDFNVQLPAEKQGSTGKYVCAQGESEEANEVLNFMRSHDLFAVNTKFRKRKSPATYLHVVAQGTAGVHDQYLGREVKVSWKGTDMFGKIIENHAGEYGTRRWKVQFTDGYVKSYSESDLENILVLRKRETEGKQLDYIMVSNRWLTSVEDASVKWGPSEHRNIYGRADHALVCCKWIWKIQTNKLTPAKDFNTLDPHTPEGETSIAKFDEAVDEKDKELKADAENLTIEQQYANMRAAIDHAIQSTLPNKKRGGRIARKVSKRTRDLFDKRTQMSKDKKKRTKADYKRIQQQIK